MVMSNQSVHRSSRQVFIDIQHDEIHRLCDWLRVPRLGTLRGRNCTQRMHSRKNDLRQTHALLVT